MTSALASALARCLDKHDVPGLPKFSHEVTDTDVHFHLGRDRLRSSETVLLTRCLKFLDFIDIFERLTQDLSDRSRCNASDRLKGVFAFVQSKRVMRYIPNW